MNNIISVVITTFNRYDFLIQAIDSVLMQTYKNFEIIIIDDCSTDQRYKSLYSRSDCKYYVNNTNLGASKSRLRGIELSNGAYIIFMDDDDFYTNEKFFELAINIFTNKSNPHLSFVSGNANLYNSDLDKILPGDVLDFVGLVESEVYMEKFQFKYKKPYSTFTSVFDNTIVKNKIVPSVKMFNDSSIYLHALLYGSTWFLKDVVGLYRIHESNMTKSLNYQFIIENLYEKYQVSRISSDIFKFDKQLWLYNQFLLTSHYYMNSSTLRLDESLNYLFWNITMLNGMKYKILFFLSWLVNILKTSFKSYFKWVLR